jgi:hypothetical protein
MTSIYSPNGTIVANVRSPNAPALISSVSNATPAVVTSAGHGMQTGDNIEIELTGVVDGQWVVTVIDANNFSLNGSTASGTASSGQFWDYTLNPLSELPSDGALASAANLLTPVEGALNMGPFLNRRLGKWRVYDSMVKRLTDDSFTTNWSSTVLGSSYATLTSATGLITSANTYPPSAGVHDLIHVDFRATCSLATSGVTPTAAIALGISVNGGSYSVVSASGQRMQPAVLSGSNVSEDFRVALEADFTLSPGGTYNFALMGVAINAAVTTTLVLVGSWSISVTQYRQNGF